MTNAIKQYLDYVKEIYGKDFKDLTIKELESEYAEFQYQAVYDFTNRHNKAIGEIYVFISDAMTERKKVA